MRSKIQNITIIKVLMAMAFLIGFQSYAVAQHSVSGTVYESVGSTTLPGVNISIKGTQQGGVSNVNGMYQLTTPSASDTLVFSYIGYATLEVPIDGRSVVDVTLTPADILGEEVVVVGYGTQRREDITSSVVSVRAEDFRAGAPRDAADLIKGRIAGLVLSTSDGNPTSGTDISLRGTTTLTASSSPLVLIDGIPGNLNTVAPQDVESISVLKDGSGAAIYGSRGTNGVILVTTKSHDGFRPATVTYQGYVNYQQIVKQPDFMSAEEYRNAIQQNNANFTDYGFATDWQDQVLREPISHNHSLSLSGGNATTNYTASINFVESEGIFHRSNNEDLRSRVSISHSMLDDNLRANVNLTYGAQTHFNGSNGGGSFNGNVWYQSLIRNPTDQMRNEDGMWQERPGFNYDNPLALLYEVAGETENRTLRLDGTISWDPIENLSLQLLGASNRGSQIRGYAENFNHQSTTVENLNGFASRNTSSGVENLLEFTATYADAIEDHSFNILGGYSWQEEVNEFFNVNNRNFPTDLFTYNDIGIGTGLQEGLAGMGSGKVSTRLIGFFGRFNYDYDGRFILMGSARYEGDSRFGANHKWGWFPGASVGWRISNESFMENVDFIDDLKVRAGFGITGIAPGGAYQSLASYEFSGGANFFYDGENWVRYLEPSRNANPELRWERKEELNIGVDFELAGRISGSIDVYRRDTKDLLFDYSVPTPPYLYDEILANVGQMRNEGIEVALQFDAIQTQELFWSTGINYSTNRNELVSLSNDQFETENNFINAGFIGESVQVPSHRLFVGGKVGNFYGYKTIDVALNCDYMNSQGNCAADGQWIIEGADGQPKTYFDLDLDDRQVLGNGVPKHNLSWNNNFRYKNFDLNIFIRGAFGFQILNETRLFYENPTQTGLNLLDSAFHDVYGKTALTNEWQYMSYYIEDGDYVKIDNITLGYTFDVAQYGISNARVYVSGRNLHTFTSYKGLDPEVDVSGLDPGYDTRGGYPTTRTFTFGVNLSF